MKFLLKGKINLLIILIIYHFYYLKICLRCAKLKQKPPIKSLRQVRLRLPEIRAFCAHLT